MVYIRHWRQFGDVHSRDRAYGLLRTVAYMQTVSDDPATPSNELGNFVLWMQPNGTLNRSADPPETPAPSDSGASYWLARAIWAFGEGYEAFRDADPAFAGFIQERLGLALDALDRQVLVPYYGTYRILDGAQVPAWLIVDGADASSEAVYGLSAYVRAGGDARARADLVQLADGLAQMRLSADASTWPFGAILPWAGSRSVWHAWGDQMAGALATAGTVLGEQRFIDTAVSEVASFTPHLLAQGGADQGWLPAPAERAQIAYGADATLQNLLRTADAGDLNGFRQLAAMQAAWYFGNNRSGVQMYDPATGRTFDGLEADGRVNPNSGAESTIHGLLSMLALDARPAVAAAATSRNGRVPNEQLSWTLLEAEAGVLKGKAVVVTPPSAWTGESLWSGGKYVKLLPGGRVTVAATLPEAGRYRLLPVFDRQEAPLRSIGTRHRFDNVPLGIVWHGGAGAQGVSPTSGYLDIGNVGSDRVLANGPVAIESAYVGEGRAVRLDALLLQPEVERLLLGGGRQGLLRSWATERRLATVDAGATVLTAYAYDAAGRLVETVSGTGSLMVPVEPYGFTYLLGG